MLVLLDGKKSTVVITLGNGLIHENKNPKCVAKSSMEAKYMALQNQHA